MKKSSLFLIIVLTHQIIIAQVSTFDIKVFLEGPYFNEQMTPFLNVLGEMPTTQPYNVDPWNYNGGEQVVSIPNFNIVDWILVDVLALEQGNNGSLYTIKTRKACFLLKNGDVVDLDGNSLLSMNTNGADDFYLRIIHRNHLSVISSSTITNSGGIYSYDFTTGPDKVMGESLNIVQLNTNLWGMISGDGDANGQIDNKDKDEVWLLEKNLTGYYHGDFNMDTQVDDDDKVNKWMVNTGRSAFLINDTIAPPPIWVCGDTFTDIRDGQAYSSVQIGSQCWMAENLNIGEIITTPSSQSDNNIIEKYCYDNDSLNCGTYGGLYQWDEMMQYTTAEGTQGICPDDWHVPSDFEWFTMENHIDPSITDPALKGWRGTDAGTKLKQGGSSGFESLYAGFYSGSYSNFIYMGTRAYFRTSSLETGTGFSFYRIIDIDYPTSYKNASILSHGYSVRCIKDTSSINNPPGIPFNPLPEDNSTNIGIDTTLSWSCIDPEQSDLSYNIYFGSEQNPPLLDLSYTDTIYQLDLLKFESTYYWRIVAYDVAGDSTEGPLWSFSTKSFDCGDLFFDSRDGQDYKTVQIGSQCWMAENLNIGEIITTPSSQSDNNIIEKYCYDNDSLNCGTYGGLYQWDEMMQYTTAEGTQGICPDGWHVPSDFEWFTMENHIDPSITDPELKGWRGTNAGTLLKQEGTSGFESLYAGSYSGSYSNFIYLGTRAYFRTSSLETGSGFSFYRIIDIDYPTSYKNASILSHGYSVRCIKD